MPIFDSSHIKTGAVTYIQRFGSALNLNIQFHMLFLEGVITQEHGKMTFKRVKAPSHSVMEALVHTISHRIAQYLEKAGLIQRNMDNTYLDLPIDDEDSLLHLQAASVSYRIAVGPDTGKKVFTLQTIPATDPDNLGQLAKISELLVIKKILDHLDKIASSITEPRPSLLPPLRAPPEVTFDDTQTIQRDFDWGA